MLGSRPAASAGALAFLPFLPLSFLPFSDFSALTSAGGSAGASTPGAFTGAAVARSGAGVGGAAGACASAAIALLGLQPAAAFVALTLEDEADEAPTVEIADVLEGDREASHAVDAHHLAPSRYRQHSLGDRELELDLLADLQGVGAREQETASAEIDRVALDLLAISARVDHHGPGGLNANVLAFLEHLDRARPLDAQHVGLARIIDDGGAAQAHAPTRARVLEHHAIDRPPADRLGRPDHGAEQRVGPTGNPARVYPPAGRSAEDHRLRAPGQLHGRRGLALVPSQSH